MFAIIYRRGIIWSFLTEEDGSLTTWKDFDDMKYFIRTTPWENPPDEIKAIQLINL